jgi:two-component system, NarL family, response regulator LiaR
MENQPIQVLIVDDQTIVRKAIRAALEEYQDILVVGEAPNGLVALDLVDRLNPDVVLIDISMPVMDGVEATQRIIANHPDMRIIVLTGLIGEDKCYLAIKAGAMGYLTKDIHPEELVKLIQNVHKGEPAINPKLAWKLLHGMNAAATTELKTPMLSKRELDVLHMLTLGKTDPEIAKDLFVTEVTIRTHIKRILYKLGLENRVQAVLYSIRTGFVSLEETRDMESYW